MNSLDNPNAKQESILGLKVNWSSIDHYSEDQFGIVKIQSTELPALYRYIKHHAAEHGINLEQPPAKGEWDWKEEPENRICTCLHRETKCLAVHDGWSCSRQKGHHGPHVSCGLVKHRAATWPQEPETLAEAIIQGQIEQTEEYIQRLDPTPRTIGDTPSVDDIINQIKERLAKLEDAQSIKVEPDHPELGDPEVCTEEQDWRVLGGKDIIRDGDEWKDQKVGTWENALQIDHGMTVASVTSRHRPRIFRRPLYRKLGPDEIIQEGDEVSVLGEWKESGFVGEPCTDGLPMRRRIKEASK